MKAFESTDIGLYTVRAWAEANNKWGTHLQNAEALLQHVKDELVKDKRMDGRQIYKIELSGDQRVFIVTFAHGEQANVSAVPFVNQI